MEPTQEEQTTAAPAAPAPASKAPEPPSWRRELDEAFFKRDFQAACLLLNGRSMDELLTTLGELYLTAPLRELDAFAPQAQGIFKERLLVALDTVRGVNPLRLERNLALLPTDQVQVVRQFQAAQAAARKAVSPLLGGLPLPPFPVPGGGPPAIPPLPATPESKLIEDLKRAIKVPFDGLTITRGQASLNISATGLIAKLGKEGDSASLEASVTQSLTFVREYRNVRFSASLSADTYTIQFTVGVPDPIPSLYPDQLAKVMNEGAGAVRSIAAEAARFKSLKDIGPIKDAIKPHTQPVSDAIDAVKGIAGAAGVKPLRPQLGLSLGGPAPGAKPGDPGVPLGPELKGTLTIFF